MIIKHSETNPKGNLFASSDLALAATISIYFPVVIIDKQDPRKALFVFKRSNKLDELVDKYWNKELLVEPRTYFDSIKALKARLYANE